MVKSVAVTNYELYWQETDFRFSQVRPISCNVDPAVRYCIGATPYKSDDAKVQELLDRVAWLLELSYGYRKPMHSYQRFTRRAASAGAMYPTELFVTFRAGEKFVTLYYRFDDHNFYFVSETRDRGEGDCSALEPRVNIHFASVLWRTVQRYGVRGYRYCILDAANVLDGMIWALKCINRDVEYKLLSRRGPLDGNAKYETSERVLFTLSISPESLKPIDQMRSLDEENRFDSYLEDEAEFTPALCPSLTRVLQWHDRVTSDIGEILIAKKTEGVAPGKIALLDERYSVREFDVRDIDGTIFDAIGDHTRSFMESYEHVLQGLKCYLIPVRVTGRQGSGASVITGSSVQAHQLDLDSSELAMRVQKVCQNQAICGNASIVAVLGTERPDINQLTRKEFFYSTLLIGLLTSEYHRISLYLNVGTTIIGGFSDNQARSLLKANSFQPIAIQLFGVPTVDMLKVDAPPIVGKSLDSNRIN